MKISPLQLRNCWFTEVCVKMHPDGLSDITHGLEVQQEVGMHKERPLNWLVRLKVKVFEVDGKQPRVTGCVEAMGEFEVEPAWPEEKRELLVSVNGSSIVYSAIREMFASITARSPAGILTLPTQSFVPDAPKEHATKKPNHGSEAKPT